MTSRRLSRLQNVATTKLQRRLDVVCMLGLKKKRRLLFDVRSFLHVFCTGELWHKIITRLYLFLKNILVESKKYAPHSQRKEMELYELELNGRDDFLSYFHSIDL